MGQFASSVGLVSGINSAEIIDQLVAIESQGVNRVEQQNSDLQETQSALNEVSARLLSINLDAARLTRPSTFGQTTASSSNEEVATASSSIGAPTGEFQVTVSRLVSSQQSVSRGFADATEQAISPEPRLLAFSRGGSSLTNEVPLEALNGGRGIERGSIRVIDHTQKSRLLDLSGVNTLQEAAERFNSLSVAVRATVVDGGLVISNDSNLPQTGTQRIRLSNVGLDDVLGSLGIAADPVNGEIVGRQLNVIGRDTDLASLRDNRGVRFGAGADLIFNTADGQSFAVDLSGTATLGEVFDRIDESTDGAVAVFTRPDGRGLEINDQTTGPGAFSVEGVASSGALEGLGFADPVAAGATLTGDRLRGSLTSKLLGPAFGGRGLAGLGGEAFVPVSGDTALDDLFGGAGLTTSNRTGPGPTVADAVDDLTVTTADGIETGIDLDGVATVGELLDTLNTGLGGRATAFLQDDRLIVADHTEGDAAFSVESPTGIAVAAELGLAGVARGGTAVGRLLDPAGPAQTGASITIRNAAGGVTVVDFTGAETADDLINRVNQANAGVEAQLNSVGDGIALLDTTGGVEALRIESVAGGVLAEQLGLAGEFRSGRVQGRSLQYAFADGATSLQSLGVTPGSFTIQDSDGRRGTIDLTEDVPAGGATLGDVIAKINAQGIALTARINDTGDGLLLEDTGSGANPVEVIDVEGEAAVGLRLAGTFEGASLVDGSLRTYVASGPGGTLQDLASAISSSDAGVNASVIDDGSSGRPFRLSITGETAGAAFGFTLDDGGLALRSENLSEARDALAFVGGSGTGGVAVTSTSNQLVGVVPGATIDLLRASPETITISIAADAGSVTSAVTDFVDGFNELADRLGELDSFDAETNTRGILLGDPTVARVRTSLYNAVINANSGLPGSFRSLAEVGVTVGSGGRLDIDSARLEEAFSTDPASFQQLFAFGASAAAAAAAANPDVPVDVNTQTFGIAVEINNVLDRLTDIQFGSVQGRIDTLDRQILQNNDRIDQLNVLIDGRRARLQAEFAGLESVIAGFQDQSSSLATLSQLATAQRGG